MSVGSPVEHRSLDAAFRLRVVVVCATLILLVGIVLAAYAKSSPV